MKSKGCVSGRSPAHTAPRIIRACLLLWSIGLPAWSANAEPNGGLIARYLLDEGAGRTVRDSMPREHAGTVVGEARWRHGSHRSWLRFNGQNRVEIRDPAIDQLSQLTVSAWVSGSASPFRMVFEPSHERSLRGVYFQITGNVIHFASNSDILPAGADSYISQLVTGTVDINLTHWSEVRRTEPPLTALEPKLQVVGSDVYYEYFGHDRNSISQVWAAHATDQGRDFLTRALTAQTQPGRTQVEQGDIEVAGGEIYYAWPQRDQAGFWQVWTAQSKVPGDDFTARQRTHNGRAIVAEQIVDGEVFYQCDKYWAQPPQFARKDGLNDYDIAVSPSGGNGWRVIRTFSGIHSLRFIVDKGRVHFAFIGPSRGRRYALFTGSMRVDGSNYRAIERTFGEEPISLIGQGGIRVVGDRVYYALEKARSLAFGAGSTGKNGFSFWTAEARTDDSDWKASRRTDGRADIRPKYKSLEVVGAKAYYSLVEETTDISRPFRPILATAGANIIAKGDAFGLGLTEAGSARAFVNAGQDYLYRGEAPADVGGGTAGYVIDERWHFLAMTYDQQDIKLYVDGKLRSTTPYTELIGRNPFPLMVGDGFVGLISEVSIYDHALSAQGIRDEFVAEELKRAF